MTEVNPSSSSPHPLQGAAAEIPSAEHLDVPADAGKYRDALTTVLLRIPDSWSRTISCGAGWYPLIAKLHVKLCDVDIDYEVHQIKEKYGTLRYYAEPQTDDTIIQERFSSLIGEAETQSARVCEWCGNPGQLCMDEKEIWRSYKTLCPQCTTASGDRGHRYVPVATTRESSTRGHCGAAPSVTDEPQRLSVKPPSASIGSRRT